MQQFHKILLVEDDLDDQEIFYTALAEIGFIDPVEIANTAGKHWTL